jgi:uncharacterized protein (DUF1810 family)
MNHDPYGLQRFIDAQAQLMPRVEAELRAGRKSTHWMWFVFPQMRGLGQSAMAQRYGIASLDEAQAYLAHPLLGERLRHCCTLVLAAQGGSAHDIFGSPDDNKFRSSLTLFRRAAPQEPVFGDCLRKYYNGIEDPATLKLLRLLK